MNLSLSKARRLMIAGIVIIAASSIWMMVAVNRAFSEVKTAMGSDEMQETSAALRNWSDFNLPPIAMLLCLLGWISLVAGAVVYLRRRFRKDCPSKAVHEQTDS